MTTTDTQPTLPAGFTPGAVEGMPFDEYLAVPAMNHSTLSNGWKSMRRLKMVMDDQHNEEPSSAMNFGTHAHVAIWELPRFLREYVCLPEIKPDDPDKYTNFKATKEYKTKLADLQKLNEGKTCLEHDDYRRIIGIVEALAACPDAKERIRSNGPHEVSLFWIDETTGVPCKARLDKIILDGYPVIPDLKATAEPYYSMFQRIATRLRYFDKAAWYRAGVKAVYGVDADFDLIAVGDKPPHDCYVYRVEEMSIKQGERNNRDILKRYVFCRDNDDWPSGPPGVQPLGLPSWAVDDDISEESDGE